MGENFSKPTTCQSGLHCTLPSFWDMRIHGATIYKRRVELHGIAVMKDNRTSPLNNRTMHVGRESGQPGTEVWSRKQVSRFKVSGRSCPRAFIEEFGNDPDPILLLQFMQCNRIGSILTTLGG